MGIGGSRADVVKPVVVDRGQRDIGAQHDRQQEADGHPEDHRPHPGPGGIGDLHRGERIPRDRGEAVAAAVVGPVRRVDDDHLARRERRGADWHGDRLVQEERVGKEPEPRLGAEPHPRHVVDEDEHDHCDSHDDSTAGQPAEVDHPSKGQKDADEAPPIGDGLVRIRSSGLPAEGDAHCARQVVASRPDGQRRDGEHGSGSLEQGGGELTDPVEGRPLRGGPGCDGDDMEAEPHKPEEPAGEGEILGDEIGDGDEPRQEHQVDLVQTRQRPDAAPFHHRDRPQRNRRDGGRVA